MDRVSNLVKEIKIQNRRQNETQTVFQSTQAIENCHRRRTLIVKDKTCQDYRPAGVRERRMQSEVDCDPGLIANRALSREFTPARRCNRDSTHKA